ncbi:MAG: DNA repair protein RecO [Acholeplasmataceae bacterium]|jgi:DNA repair protein RecO (recombination protein O)|nr:DNA repair protein RecO [Acholeplasmataceae bacterium]
MEGIIFKVQPYQEHSRLLFVYTNRGKVTLLAQGAQKVNHASRILSQFLTHIDFKEGKKSFYPLQEGKIIHDFHEIKNDFQLTKYAALMLEIVDHLVVENADHSLIFNELILALKSPFIDLSALSFSLKMINLLGYGMDLSPDGRKVKGVSIEKGSLVYQGEADQIDLDTKDAITLLKLSVMPYSSLDQSLNEHLDKIKEFILKYYSYHLQTTLKNLQ